MTEEDAVPVLLVCVTCGHPLREHDLNDAWATCPGLS